MSKDKNNVSKLCEGACDSELSCCKIVAVVSVDERGQMVLPKELREKANIKAGDKLAVIDWKEKGETMCLGLIKAHKLEGLMKEVLGPMFKSMSK